MNIYQLECYLKGNSQEKTETLLTSQSTANKIGAFIEYIENLYALANSTRNYNHI